MSRLLREGTSLIVTTVLGSVLVVAGLVMLVTPGPGILAIAAGVALLSRHHHWARRLRDRVSARWRGADPGTT
jgi:drug/metabolite transporter (DMT)-like permease